MMDKDTSSTVVEVDVLIVGGGPVGEQKKDLIVTNVILWKGQ